jgi:hypothetical protein
VLPVVEVSPTVKKSGIVGVGCVLVLLFIVVTFDILDTVVIFSVDSSGLDAVTFSHVVVELPICVIFKSVVSSLQPHKNQHLYLLSWKQLL